jgi:hypothetical protein
MGQKGATGQYCQGFVTPHPLPPPAGQNGTRKLSIPRFSNHSSAIHSGFHDL